MTKLFVCCCDAMRNCIVGITGFTAHALKPLRRLNIQVWTTLHIYSGLYSSWADISPFLSLIAVSMFEINHMFDEIQSAETWTKLSESSCIQCLSTHGLAVHCPIRAFKLRLDRWSTNSMNNYTFSQTCQMIFSTTLIFVYIRVPRKVKRYFLIGYLKSL